MVLYALVSNSSIGYLFLGGIIPGLMMGTVLMAMNSFIAHRRGYQPEESIPLSRLPGITFNAFPALLMPAILLYGIYGGVTTPTEAAAVAAFYALILASIFYRALSFDSCHFISSLKSKTFCLFDFSYSYFTPHFFYFSGYPGALHLFELGLCMFCISDRYFGFLQVLWVHRYRQFF